MPGRHGGERRDEHGVALLGRSAVHRELLRRIERVAPTEATVLILGERGTGKELVAQALHATSPRRTRPLVAINCAALSPELLANELFGHERGAFTGATERRPGLLASAQHGTVFFDEVGDLASLGQAMLLRFLQEREVRPLGATASHQVDVRVIAATNRDLEGAAFRADLYDRLSEVTIRVPPLRERAGDIPLLAEHFLALHARRHGLPRPRLSADALAVLTRYTWPGNVRELEKALSRAVIFCEGGWVRPGDLELGRSDERLRRVADRDAPPVAGAEMSELAGTPPLTARQREILHRAFLSGSIRRGDVMRRFGISGEAARRDLVVLARLGLAQREGRGRGAEYRTRQTRSE